MWKRQGVITLGINYRAQVPVVDTEQDGFWRIYFSHRDINNHSYISYIDVEPHNPKNIINQSKSPILSPGLPGSVDASGVMPTSILTVGSFKYLYYIGWTQRLDVPYFNNTCLAISKNGEEWHKLGPILSPNIKDQGYSGTFYPIKVGNRYISLYLSCKEWRVVNGIYEPFYDLRIAESYDAIDWDKKGIAISRLEGVEGGLSQASILEGKNYQTWFSSRGIVNYRTDLSSSYKILYAESTNLLEWNRVEDKDFCLYPTGNSYDWDGIMTCYPCVIKVDSYTYMFYNGNGFGKTGIGYAQWV